MEAMEIQEEGFDLNTFQGDPQNLILYCETCEKTFAFENLKGHTHEETAEQSVHTNYNNNNSSVPLITLSSDDEEDTKEEVQMHLQQQPDSSTNFAQGFYPPKYSSAAQQSVQFGSTNFLGHANSQLPLQNFSTEPQTHEFKKAENYNHVNQNPGTNLFKSGYSSASPLIQHLSAKIDLGKQQFIQKTPTTPVQTQPNYTTQSCSDYCDKPSDYNGYNSSSSLLPGYNSNSSVNMNGSTYGLESELGGKIIQGESCDQIYNTRGTSPCNPLQTIYTKPEFPLISSNQGYPQQPPNPFQHQLQQQQKQKQIKLEEENLRIEEEKRRLEEFAMQRLLAKPKEVEIFQPQVVSCSSLKPGQDGEQGSRSSKSVMPPLPPSQKPRKGHYVVFNCRFCREEFPSVRAIVGHEAKYHRLRKDQVGHFCKRCGKRYASAATLKNHLQEHHLRRGRKPD